MESAAVLEEERWSPGLLQIGNKILHIGTGSADLRAGPDVGGQPRCQATNGKTLFQGPASREIDQPEVVDIATNFAPTMPDRGLAERELQIARAASLPP